MNTGKVHIFAVLCAIALASVAGAQEPAASEKDWKVELEEVCAKTDVSMTLSVEELENLITRCGGLEKRIGEEDKVVRKIYLRRVKRCKDLFVYVLQSKSAEAVGEDGTETSVKEDQESTATQ